VIGIAPYWQDLREQARARSAIAGVNASVVGLLAAALVKMVMAISLRDPTSVCLVGFDFFLLWLGKVSPFFVVIGSAAALVLAHGLQMQ
jgi:chromate transporter